MYRFACIWMSAILVVFLAGCSSKTEYLISGRTMGTTYHVKIVSPRAENTDDLKQAIDRRLLEINRSMSTYQADSEISKFNALRDVEERFYASDDFLSVMAIALELYRLSGGAWDGTVNPLVNLWGFGSASGEEKTVPAEAEIEKRRADVGFHRISFSESRYLKKNRPGVTLDLASIAKGFGVDQIAELLRFRGFENFLVEIGGEVFASGVRGDGTSWQVGINVPRKDAAQNAVYKVLTLRDAAMATSGDYRNFFEIDNVRYSHVLDPRTGYPVSNGVVSATVIAENCTFADGLATAVMVLGHEKGLALVNRLKQVECLVVVENRDGNLREYHSDGFES